MRMIRVNVNQPARYVHSMSTENLHRKSVVLASSSKSNACLIDVSSTTSGESNKVKVYDIYVTDPIFLEQIQEKGVLFAHSEPH